MPHVLVVDDEIGIRELLREILEDGGYQVSTASNAAEANRRLRADHPDLVLLDLSLPDRDGLSLIREWASARTFRTPVVMLSAYGSVDNAVEATRLGASDFLEKPIALPKLLAAVKRATSISPPPTAAVLAGVVAAGTPPGQADTEDWARSAFGLPYREARIEFERAYFLNALTREGGRLQDVATRTGIERTHLYRKIKALGLRSLKRRS